VPQVPPEFQNRRATMDPGSLPGSWNPTPKQEQTKMHPKQHRQPAGSTADTPSHEEADPDLIKALFEQMTLSLRKDIKSEIKSEMSTLRSELVPRVAALEARTKDERTSPGHRHRDPDEGGSSRGRRRDDSPQRRQSRDKHASSRHDKRNPSRQRRRSRDDSESPRRRRYDRDEDDDYKDRRPRFRTDSLQPVRYGDDVATWLVEMDHIVLKHGEEIVCPEIFGHCFQSGDAIKLWYMGLDPDLRKHYTTGPGCWKRFRNVMERRFTADVALRQLAAEDRSRLQGETYAEFAIKKVALIRTSFAHLEEGAMIAMVKRKLDFEAAQFCREKTTVEAFVSELIEYDNLRDMQTGRRQPPAPTRWTQQGHGQQHEYPFEHDYRDESARVPPTQFQPQQPAAPYRQPTGAQASRATGSNAVYVDPRLSTIQPRKHPHTGIDTLSYLDRSGKAVFLQRPCGHCEAMGKKNVWHFDFSCANKSAPSGRRDRAYAGDGALPGTVESPSGHPTSYTFTGFANDPGPDKNPFSIDDVYGESGNGAGDQ
jgi:hypothetical protein